MEARDQDTDIVSGGLVHFEPTDVGIGPMASRVSWSNHARGKHCLQKSLDSEVEPLNGYR